MQDIEPLVSDSTRSNLSVVDIALERLGAPGLLQNSHFEEGELSDPNYLTGILHVKDRGAARISFSISKDSIVIGIEDVHEAIEWPNEYVIQNREQVINTIVDVLSCYMFFEWHGSTRTDIHMIDSSGGEIRQIIYREGISIGKKSTRRLYFPAYAIKSLKES